MTGRPNVNYGHAPIVEAVIELQFAEEISWNQVMAAADRLKPKYFFDDSEREQGVNLAPQNMTIAVRDFGRLLSSLEATDVMAIRLSSFLASRRAPYRAWEPLFERFMDHWTSAKRDIGNQPIKQMGVRYINRIDVPTGEHKHIADYLKVGPSFPEPIGRGPLMAFTCQFERALDDDVLVKLTTGSVESPVPGCAGLLLDIDVIWKVARILANDEIVSMAAKMRDWKNEVFELSITDNVRELIK